MLWAPLLIESVDGMLASLRYVAKCGKAQPFCGGGVETRKSGKVRLPKAKRTVSCRESMYIWKTYRKKDLFLKKNYFF